MNEAAYLVEMRRYDVISHEGLISKEKTSIGNKTPQRLSHRHLLVTLCHGFYPRRLRVKSLVLIC
jgi:hypothetical protein